MLKSLELFGFKSFADRTRFDFASGITCVVGPNGSGKSNVVDSIKWILGDQSPKSLRGKEMTDVIFNGSGSRKPAGLAEASLTFDNTSRFLALDADEVQIGRRIYRSGEAEYLINRTPARLKDIKELFTGTGASAYSIIEQGRVDQLLQATNLNRRIVFEEAAGISRFKVRKVDAQRKLERVAQNLLRLTDIVKEVESQLLTTRSQATKAAKYRELSQELRVLRLGLAADDYWEMTARLVEIDAERADLQSQVTEASTEAQESEDRQKNVDSQVAEVEDRLRAAEHRDAENRETIAGHEATIRHQRARRQELDAEFARLEQQQTELVARASAVAGELEQTVDHLQKYSEEFDRRKEELSARESAVGELGADLNQQREELEQRRGQMLDLVRQISVLGNRVTALHSQAEGLQAARQRLLQRLERVANEVAVCREELIRRQAAVHVESQEFATLRDEFKGVHDRRAELLQQQGEQQQRLLELREQRSAMLARRSLLEDLELRQEGLGVGVKDILARARDADRPPWNHVLGNVVDLLEVDIENAALMEVALGNRAQLIVLDDAGPLVDFLNEGSCQISGRVGFLAVWQQPGGNQAPRDNRTLPSLPGAGLQQRTFPDLAGQPGIVDRADRLIRSATSVRYLAEQLLADTWIVSTLDDALRLAATTGPDCRYVTLQGELLESDGTLFVGSVRSESALVSRKSELRGIKNDLLRLERQIVSEEQGLLETGEQLKEIDELWQRLQEKSEASTQRLADLKSSVSSQELDLERLEHDRGELQAELDRNDSELGGVEPQLEEAQLELARYEGDMHSLQAEMEQQEQLVTRREQEFQSQRTELAGESMALAKHEERLQSLHSTRTRLDQEHYQRNLHRDEAERRFQSLAARREQIDTEIAEVDATLSELLARREVFVTEVAKLQAEREQVRQMRGEFAERELKHRHRLRDLKERVHVLDMKSSEIRHQLANLTERLQDEYQLELAEVAASGVSAKADYLAAHQPEDADEPAGEDLPAPVVAEPASSPPADGIRQILDEQMNRCRRKLKQLGQVNTDSLKELDELETRFTRLSTQLQDLVEARDALEEIIRRINTESRRMFTETFGNIRQQFQELFRKLFGGGEGDVVLENPDDILECGIDIVARPPGKELRSISLLSGGEKTMTAVALLLAIFKSKPSPFCILDEVDAALDEGNVNRYLGIIREFQEWTQFIVITHSKRTMSGADLMYGVTMEEAGVSKRMSVRFEDISSDGQIANNADRTNAA